MEGRENTVSLSNVHTREVIMIVCVSIIPGPLRVKVPSPSLPNLSLELAVADLSSLKVKGTTKKREREREREGGREGGEGEVEREGNINTVFTMYVHILKASAKSSIRSSNVHCYLSVHSLPFLHSRQLHSLGTCMGGIKLK